MSGCANDEALVPHQLFDNNGDVYVVYVSKSVSSSLDLDHMKSYRLLLDVKANSQPVSRWSSGSGGANSSANATAEGSVWQPGRPSTGAVPRARGKNGALWPVNATKTFLDVCSQYKDKLRAKQLPISFWEMVSDQLLLDKSLNYSAEALREKMRNLKRMYAETKLGKHPRWEYVPEMYALLDEDISQDKCNETIAQKQHQSAEASVLRPPSPNVCVRRGAQYEAYGEVSLQSENIYCADTLTEEVLNWSIDENSSEGAVPTVEPPEEDKTVNSMLEGSTFLVCATSTPSKNKDNTLHGELRSPPAKKGAAAAKHSSRPVTPKRKVSTYDLAWAAEDTEAFVKICVELKGEVQADIVPIRVWKVISERMACENKNHSWEQCRAKFGTLNKFFKDGALKVQGMFGGVMWPYYNMFLDIHDIPKNYEPRNLEHTQTGNDKLWNPNTVDLLITEYERRKDSFQGTRSGVRSDVLYAEIASTFEKYDMQVTGEQCRSKMNQLIMEFRREYDECRRTGAAPSVWPLYDRMLTVFEKDATLEAPFAVSVGQGLSYTARGQPVEDSTRGSRTRPMPASLRTATGSKKGRQETKRSFKTWSQEMQEKQFQQKAEVLQVLTEMRLSYEQRSKERMDILKALLGAKAPVQNAGHNDSL